MSRLGFDAGCVIRCRASAKALFVLLGCLSLGIARAAATDFQSASPAIEVSRETLASHSLELKGDVLMARGSYAAALEAYQKVSPQTAVTINKMGTAYHHLFALDEAMKNYQFALKLDPHYGQAYNNLGAVYHGKQEYKLAEKAYKKALKYQPHEASTYFNLGTAYFAEGKYKKGIEAYQKAMQLDPEVFSAERRNRVEAASSKQQRMATSFYMAEVYASAGKNTEALEALRKALSEGFHDRKRLMEDKELASLRGMPEFQEMLAEQHLQ